MTPARFPHSDTPGSSSVANSPGLIAGSYVLHRLLMPRHPPYALHSLSPHTQTQQKHRSHRPTPHRQTADPQESADLSKQLQRCSRPLSNNQTTTRTTSNHPDGPPPQGPTDRRLIPQGPTACHPDPPPTSRSRPGTHHHSPTTRSTPTPHREPAAVLDAGRTPANGVNMSTIPLVSTPNAAGTDAARRTPCAGGVCSLERR